MDDDYHLRDAAYDVERRAFGISVAEILRRLGGIGTYYDVPVEEWYYYCVELATKLGIVNGYKGDVEGVNAVGSFQPGRNVSIPELMKMTTKTISRLL